MEASGQRRRGRPDRRPGRRRRRRGGRGCPPGRDGRCGLLRSRARRKSQSHQMSPLTTQERAVAEERQRLDDAAGGFESRPAVPASSGWPDSSAPRRPGRFRSARPGGRGDDDVAKSHRRQASRCQTMSGLPPAGNSGLGVWSVSGRMRFAAAGGENHGLHREAMAGGVQWRAVRRCNRLLRFCLRGVGRLRKGLRAR